MKSIFAHNGDNSISASSRLKSASGRRMVLAAICQAAQPAKPGGEEAGCPPAFLTQKSEDALQICILVTQVKN
jgi:hypothetical protein